MSSIRLINESCADQKVDAVVNAANSSLLAGGGICGVIFSKSGPQLSNECRKHRTPLQDGEAVITSSCSMTNCNYIIHAVGPDFRIRPRAFLQLFEAYYNSLCVLKENNLHSISFPLISAGIFSGSLAEPAYESARQCLRAYNSFVRNNPEYDIDVLLCCYQKSEYVDAERAFTL